MPITRAISHGARLAAGEASWPNLMHIVHATAGRASGGGAIAGCTR
jgi:hypothetical protein